MSILSRIFRASTWRGKMARLAGSTRAGIRAVGRGVRGGWTALKGFVRKYPAFTTAVAAGTAVHLIDRAMNSLSGEAMASDNRRMASTGTTEPTAAQRVLHRNALRKLRETANGLSSDGPIDRHSRRQFLEMVEAYHHYMHTHGDDETREFMVVADQTIASITRAGLCIEEGAGTDTMVRSILNIKDDTEPVSSVTSDLINTMALDQTGTPLRSL